ncbi:MAG TPA: 2Fe-2S iron-sulfur cluster-binding protein, partial [bacterium]|nr:2Fe-2S iron-sulfur cluster-binding protein [bacterium]
MANKDTKKTKKEKEQKSAEKLNLAQCSNAACGAGSGKERKLTGEKIKVTINDKELEVDKGLTILEAARKHNIHIPSLCYHEDLCVAGICRVCVVEIEGERTLKTACTYVVDRPIKIKTSSEKVRKARKFVLELMLANHFGECYSCFRNLNCELQKLAQEYGIDQLRFGHVTTPRYKVDKSSYAVVRDKDKCILCKRCIRTCVDLQEVGVLEA